MSLCIFSKTRPYYNHDPLQSNMTYNPKVHHRRSIRLKGYDYSQLGAYFITVDTHGKEPLLGKVVDGAMQLSSAGKILKNTWLDLPRHYPNICLDSICIMPDHFHAILQLNDVESGEQSYPLSEIVRALKSFSSRRINILRKQPGWPVWQRNYYEHIIRNVVEWEQIRAYMDENPRRYAMEDV